MLYFKSVYEGDESINSANLLLFAVAGRAAFTIRLGANLQRWAIRLAWQWLQGHSRLHYMILVRFLTTGTIAWASCLLLPSLALGTRGTRAHGFGRVCWIHHGSGRLLIRTMYGVASDRKNALN